MAANPNPIFPPLRPEDFPPPPSGKWVSVQQHGMYLMLQSDEGHSVMVPPAPGTLTPTEVLLFINGQRATDEEKRELWGR